MAAAAGAVAGRAGAQLPVPRLPETVGLRTVYFHNARLPAPSADFLRLVLAEAVSLSKLHLGLAVRFEPVPPRPLAEAFGVLSADEENRARAGVYDDRAGEGGRRRLIQAMKRYLIQSGRPFAAVRDEVRSDLLATVVPVDMETLAEALVETQLERLRRWKPWLADDTPHALFAAWLAAARLREWPYEVILTNQLLAAAEYDWVEVRTAMRGGVTNGITTQSPRAERQLVSVLSLFPFIANDEATVAMRGGRQGATPEAARWAAALLVHELGHQLMHLDHPYDNPACVMNPPPNLRFHQWVENLDASTCPVGGSWAMTPGAVKFRTLAAPN